ncbi:MAG TPA: GEVED domain-containing protein, partial [Planctomycetota bacterium]|nr:GEVED domain-containing protein [Planctomycetota bacterium]
VGFPGSTGTAAWNDDGNDDGIVRIEGLVPGGSCTLVLTAVDPVATFTDNVAAWMDFDGDGSWDDVGEAFAPVQVNIGPTPVTVTLGPLAVPASVGSTVGARLKVSYFGIPHGVEAAGTSFDFGEIEDYLLPVGAGTGCNVGGGGAPSIWAEDPPRQGLPFTWKEAGLAPGFVASIIIDGVNFLPSGIDIAAFAGGLVPPGTCFLYVGLSTVVTPVGVADPNGDLSVTLPVPPGAVGTLYMQGFQIGPALTVLMTPALPLTILP